MRAIVLLPAILAAAFLPGGTARCDTGAAPPHILSSPVDSLHAVRAEPPVVLLDTLHVHAPRPTRAEILRHHPAMTGVIEVDRARGPGESAPDLLERSAGISVHRYGGPGAMALLSIRGADPNQVEFFLDRTPLRTAASGSVDLSTIDLTQIERIEVYRSAPPTDLGGEASGAAVRLVTRTGGQRSLRVRLMSGSYATREVDAAAAGRWRAHRYFLSASRFSTRGDFLYHSDNGTTSETADDAWMHWTNGDVVRLNLFGKVVGMLPAGFSLEWSSQLADRDQGVPGTSRQPTHDVRFTTRTQLHRAELASPTGAPGGWHANLYGYRETTGRDYRDPLRELHLTGTPRAVAQTQVRQGGGMQVSRAWLAGPEILGAHHLEALVELRAEDLRVDPQPGHPIEDERARSSRMLSLADDAEFVAGRLGVTGSYRWERVADNYTGVDPWRPFVAHPAHVASVQGPTVGLRAILGRGHVLKANWSHQARFPTFTELFGYAGTIQGSAALRPEHGVRRDLGWIWTPGHSYQGMRLRTESAVYQNDLEEMIVFVSVSGRETKPVNLDRARIVGCEFSLEIDGLPGLRDLPLAPKRDAALAVHLTWQDARDLGRSPIYHDKQLTHHAPFQAQASLDLTQGRWELRYCAQYRASSYWGRSNLPAFQTPAQWNHDLQVRTHLDGSGVDLALRIENLLDAQLEDVRGYPLPGRSWYAEVEWHLAERSDPTISAKSERASHAPAAAQEETAG